MAEKQAPEFETSYGRQYRYIVTLRSVRANIVDVEKNLLRILSVCL